MQKKMKKLIDKVTGQIEEAQSFLISAIGALDDNDKKRAKDLIIDAEQLINDAIAELS